MPSLRELQLRFADDVLARNATAPAFARASGSRGGERLAVYQRTITSNYRNALGATYPVVRRIVGTSFFHGVVDAYADAHPSRSGDLNEYGDLVGAFLERYPPAAELPYLPDVARLEWAIDESNRAADSAFAPDAVLGVLAEQPASALPGLRFSIEPSCRFASSPFPLLRIWQVNQAGHTDDLEVDFTAGPDHLRIRREPESGGDRCDGSGGIVIERMGAGDACWLSALAQGVTLGEAFERAQAADATFDLQGALHRFIGDGCLAGIGGVFLSGFDNRAATEADRRG